MATWTTTSDLLSSVRAPMTPRLVSFSASPALVLVTRIAGAMPKTMPVVRATADANSSTRQSRGAAATCVGRSCRPQ